MSGELNSNTANETLSAALAYAERGWPVFPCAHDKRPLTTHGLKDATLDEHKIKEWWTRHPDALVAVPTGAPSGFFVLDVDMHDDVDGFAAWNQMSAAHVVPPTRQHRTANSGLHFLWKFDPSRPITNRRGDLPRGLDVRGTGGYVIMPPSRTRDGGAWSVGQMDNIADAPEFLYDVIGGSQKTREALAAHDSDSDSIRIPDNYARKALEDEVQKVACAPRGQRNYLLNNAAFSLGQLVGANALRQEEVESRLHGAAMANGLVQDDGHTVVRATIASGLGAGVALPRRMPERSASSSTASTASTASASSSQEEPVALHWHGDAYNAPLQEWLVDKTLPKVGTAFMSGQWGTYKTFVAFDLAIAVGVKSTFAGREVMRQGGTLFIAVEGQSEVRVRLEAAAAEKARPALGKPDAGRVDVDPDRLPFVWLESCPTLTADDAARKLVAIISTVEVEMQTRFGLPLALVIIDTISPAAGFKDADDTGENLKLMKVLTDTGVKFQVLLLSVDHFGKDVSTGTRNSSVKESNSDAVLALLADRDTAGKVSNQRMAIRKLRGGATGQEFSFDKRVVSVPDGKEAHATLVIDWTAQSSKAQPSKARSWSKSLKIFKRALEAALCDFGRRMKPFADGPEVLAVDRLKVREEFMKSYPADTQKAKGEAFLRAERDAVDEIMACREVTTGDGPLTVFWLLVDEATPPQPHDPIDLDEAPQ